MDEQVATLNASVARALIRAMGMQAENQDRLARGLAIAYTEQAFVDVINDEGLGYNSVRISLYGS
ncbi:MAG: hypothetical protein WC315_00665 [Candidatus Omnitrophota bacterium]|jgi:hypothetical protein